VRDLVRPKPEPTHDEVTGQRLFRPMITRRPTKDDGLRSSVPTYARLYMIKEAMRQYQVSPPLVN